MVLYVLNSYWHFGYFKPVIPQNRLKNTEQACQDFKRLLLNASREEADSFWTSYYLRDLICEKNKKQKEKRQFHITENTLANIYLCHLEEIPHLTII